MTAAVIGTPAYMAPELISTGVASLACDVYVLFSLEVTIRADPFNAKLRLWCHCNRIDHENACICLPQTNGYYAQGTEKKKRLSWFSLCTNNGFP